MAVSTAPLMKGMKAKKPFNDSQVFTFENWNQEVFDKFPDFIKEKIKASAEYPRVTGNPVPEVQDSGIESINADDIPF